MQGNCVSMLLLAMSRDRTLVIFSMFLTLFTRLSSSRSDAWGAALAWNAAAGAAVLRMLSADTADATEGLVAARAIITNTGSSRSKPKRFRPPPARWRPSGPGERRVFYHVTSTCLAANDRRWDVFCNAMSTAVGDEPVADAPPPQQEAAQDAADLFGGLKKKGGKKKKIPMDFDLDGDKPKKSEADGTPAADGASKPTEEDAAAPAPKEDAPAEDGALDVRFLTLTQFGEMKKKKKKKKTTFDLEEFEKELGEQRDSDHPEEDGENPFATEKDDDQAGGKGDDVEAWQGTDRDYTYQELLGRIFRTLRLQNPALSGEKKKYTMVPPVVQRDGSKKTVFANVLEICKRMHRQPDHVIQYLFTELGTVGSMDGSQRLVIRGRFQPKQIENVLRRYIVEYVTCKTCRSPNTLLTKENRIYFMTCEACGSQRSVSAIKTGFQAQTGKRSKMRQQ